MVEAQQPDVDGEEVAVNDIQSMVKPETSKTKRIGRGFLRGLIDIPDDFDDMLDDFA